MKKKNCDKTKIVITQIITTTTNLGQFFLTKFKTSNCEKTEEKNLILTKLKYPYFYKTKTKTNFYKTQKLKW